MTFQIKTSALFLVLLLATEITFAAPYVREASFRQIFHGTDFLGSGKDLDVRISTMSSDGKVVAFYGGGSGKPHLFIHDFASANDPVEVILPPQIGVFSENTGMVSNRDGTRIFFIADDASDTTYSDFLFCMVNGKTGAVSILLVARPSNIEIPLDIATDGNGDWLYFNESDNGDRGDMWRIATSGSIAPQLVVQAGSVSHPSGGVGRFADEMAVSDDGATITFFIDGRDPMDGSALVRWDKELWVGDLTATLPLSTPTLLTDDDNTGAADNAKNHLTISGDGSTIVYSGPGSSLMVTKAPFTLNAHYQIEDGYQNNCNTAGITDDGNRLFSSLHGVNDQSGGYIINSDGSSRYKIDTGSSYSGVNVNCTSEGVHLSSDGKRLFFKGYSQIESVGTYVNAMYTGVLDNNPSDAVSSNLWPSTVPAVTSVSYPAPLSYGIANPDDFPNFDITVGTVTGSQATAITRADNTILRANGYLAASNSYVPVWVWPSPSEDSPGIWTYKGGRGFQWPTSSNYDPLDPVIARFHVKDSDGNVGYRDVILQAAEGGCSGSGTQTLSPDDMGAHKDVSCITDGRVETDGPVVVSADMLLYLSAPEVFLNPGFSVILGGELKVE